MIEQSNKIWLVEGHKLHKFYGYRISVCDKFSGSLVYQEIIPCRLQLAGQAARLATGLISVICSRYTGN